MSEPARHEQIQHLHRVIMLSDGVFAIAITLLALEIRAPVLGPNATALQLLGKAGNHLLMYAISFAMVASYWYQHRRTFELLSRADVWLDMLNFLMLALVVLTPNATAMLADNSSSPGSIRLYVGLAAAVGLAHGLIWFYAAFVARLVPADFKPAVRLFVLYAVSVLPGAFCGLSFAAAEGHVWAWVAMPLLGMVTGVLGRALKVRRQWSKAPRPAPAG